MATRPDDTSQFAEAVYSQLAPLADQDADNGWALLIFIAAIGAMFEDIDNLAHSSPAWSLLFDVDSIPAVGLPWLGQFIGVVVNINLSEDDQRNQIRNHVGWGRGTVDAIIAAIQSYLSGDKSVFIQERDTSPYHFSIFTDITESPPDTSYGNIFEGYTTYQDFYDAFATYEDYWIIDEREQIRLLIQQIKPAGLQSTYSVVHDPFMDDTGALTVSGNEITDATRAANIQGDGLSNDSSFGIWEATTNLCTNGGFETNINGWGASGTGTTLVRSTSASKFGSASGLVTVTTAGGTNAGVSCGSIAAVTGETITFSLYVLAASGSPVLDLQVNELDGTGTIVRNTTSTATVTPSASWQRISYTVTLGSSTTQIVCYCTLHGVATNASWYIDGVQVEQQPFATPYVHTDGAAATRNAARVQVPASLLGDGTQFWVAFRVRYGWNAADRSAEFPWLFEWRTDANNRLSVAYLPSTSQWEIVEILTGTQVGIQIDAAPAVKNDETTLVFQVTPTQLKGSVDGAAFAQAARGGLLAPSGAMFDIGTIAGAAANNVFDGDVLWAACGTGTLTDQDAATLAALGDTEPKYSTLSDTAEITAIIPFDDNNYYVKRG